MSFGMKKLIKAVALCMAALTLCGVFAGCHGSDEKAEFITPEEFDTSKSYEVTFWAKNDTNVNQTRIYKKAISDFESLYPNIKVNLRLYTDYGQIYNDVITNISTGTTPDVCITYPDHIATYMTGANVVVPLDDLFTDEKYGLGGSELRFDSPTMDEMIPQILDECKLAGHYYAIPYMRSTEACYVNKTFVEALGYELPEMLTWDFVWEVSDAAAEKNADGTFKVNGQKVMLPFIYKSTDNMMIQVLRQQGAGYSNSTGEIKLFNDTTEEFLYTIADQVGKGAFSTFKISGYPGNFLNAGQCVFAVDSTAGATWMGPHAPLSDISPDKFVDFEIEVLPIPQYDTENPQMISQGPSVCVFNKDDPQQVLASWLFAQYLLTNDVQIAYSETEGYVPVTQKARDAAEYRDYLARAGEDGNEHYDVKIKAAKLLLEHTDDTFITPVFNGSTSLRDAAGQLIENVAKSVRRKETINKTYMNELYRDVRSLYRLNSVGVAGTQELGRLPGTSIALLAALGGAWALIVGWFLYSRLKKKKS